MDRSIIKLKEELMDELSEMGKKGISHASLDSLYKMAVAAEKICKMEMMDGGYDDEYSSARGRMDYSRDGDMMYRTRGYDRPYDRGSSYARRGGRGYSRDDGEDLIEKFEDMMEEAGSEREREAIRKCVEYLKAH